MQEILESRVWAKRVEGRLNVLIHERTTMLIERFGHPRESSILFSQT